MGIVNAFSNLYKILKTSHLDRDYLESIQIQQLRTLLRHAVGNSEFYQDLYQGIDVENCRLQDLPVVTKEAMMDNYDRVVTDKRLKLHQIRSWLEDKQNNRKLYLGDFSPFLTSGSTGTSAVITYDKKAIEMLLASLIANYPFLPARSISSYFRKLLAYPLKRPRVAVFAVPRGNIEPLFLRLPAQYSLFSKIKIFSLLDPLDQLVDELNRFQPDQLFSHTFLCIE